jgi:RNA polymerase sigma-70 factor (family 1)
MNNSIDSGTDDFLVIKIREDNEEAFRSLYNRYSKRVFFFSLRLLGSKEDAEELIQSVFINIWENRRALDPGKPVKSYIFRSAVNYITNHLKKKAIRNRYNESVLHKGETQTNHTYEQVFLHDLERSIATIVEALPPQQQTIFRLSHYEGLTHRDIATKLDLSERTVENHLYRVQKVLKTILKKEII